MSDRRGKPAARAGTRPAAGSRRAAPTRVRTSAKPRRTGWGAQLGRVVESIPLPAATLRRVRNWTLGLLIALALAAGFVAMGLPGMIGLGLAHAIGGMGFVVRNIEVAGRTHADADAIYRVAMDARGQDMPLVDLAGTRQALLGLGWIKDARVSRRLPDTLVVDIVERKPAAVWQYQQRLNLIDDTGTVIAPLDPRFPPEQLPLVIGPDANAHATELAALVATQPSLKPLVEGANWVGGRRWDIRFNSGETLALPEGAEAAKAAFATFARKDSQTRLLGQGYSRFDMRDGDRMVVRMTSEPGARVDRAPPPGPVT